jgi:hypothetical protein
MNNVKSTALAMTALGIWASCWLALLSGGVDCIALPIVKELQRPSSFFSWVPGSGNWLRQSPS